MAFRAGLKGSCCIGHDQINTAVDKLVGNGCTCLGVTLGVLNIECNMIFSEQLYQCIFESLCSSVQCIMLDELADTNLIDFAVGCGTVGSSFGLRLLKCFLQLIQWLYLLRMS